MLIEIKDKNIFLRFIKDIFNRKKIKNIPIKFGKSDSKGIAHVLNEDGTESNVRVQLWSKSQISKLEEARNKIDLADTRNKKIDELLK